MRLGTMLISRPRRIHDKVSCIITVERLCGNLNVVWAMLQTSACASLLGIRWVDTHARHYCVNNDNQMLLDNTSATRHHLLHCQRLSSSVAKVATSDGSMLCIPNDSLAAHRSRQAEERRRPAARQASGGATPRGGRHSQGATGAGRRPAQ